MTPADIRAIAAHGIPADGHGPLFDRLAECADSEECQPLAFALRLLASVSPAVAATKAADFRSASDRLAGGRGAEIVAVAAEILEAMVEARRAPREERGS